MKESIMDIGQFRVKIFFSKFCLFFYRNKNKERDIIIHTIENRIFFKREPPPLLPPNITQLFIKIIKFVKFSSID